MTPARTFTVQIGTALLLVIASLVGGHAVGRHHADLAVFKLYAPWQLFIWWLAFDAQAPEVFARAGAVAAFGGIASGLVAIGGAARRERRRSHNAPVTYGSARWADSFDVRKAGLLGDEGVVLGLYGGRYLRHDGPEHVLAVAPTRSGKGVGLVLPTLLTWPGSAVIHDIKGENWALTAGWRAQFSHCLLFDPANPLSTQFNPLLEVRKGLHEVRDVQNIADILIDPEGARERRDHWDKTAHALTGAILHVLYAEEEKTLARVATFLADLMGAERPVSLYLVVPPPDISRTRPLVRLILNQIARRLTEALTRGNAASSRQLLLMLDEFPALGRSGDMLDGRRPERWRRLAGAAIDVCLTTKP